MPSLLADTQIEEALTQLPGWRYEEGALRKGFTFKGFRAAIAFIDRLAEVAIAARHHPDIANHYNVVEIVVTTHAAGGVTDADVALARGIEGVATPEGSPPVTEG